MSYKAAGYDTDDRDYNSPAEPPPGYDYSPSSNPFAVGHQSSYIPAQPSSSREPPSAYMGGVTKRTAPPPPQPCPPFETFTVPALGYRLADGFATDLPTANEQPHPFSLHDVVKEEWVRFILDVNGIVRHSSEERLRENFNPKSSSRGAVPGLNSARGGLVRGLLGAAIEAATSRAGGSNKAAQEPISLLLVEWNQKYWNHRQIEVTLVLQETSDPGTMTPGRSGLLGASGDERRQARREQKQERAILARELIADVHSMINSKEASSYRASADQARYSGKPGWRLVFRYIGSAKTAGDESGWATRF